MEITSILPIVSFVIALLCSNVGNICVPLQCGRSEELFQCPLLELVFGFVDGDFFWFHLSLNNVKFCPSFFREQVLGKGKER